MSDGTDPRHLALPGERRWTTRDFVALLEERDTLAARVKELEATIAACKGERDELVRACETLCMMRINGNGADLGDAIDGIEVLVTRAAAEKAGENEKAE